MILKCKYKTIRTWYVVASILKRPPWPVDGGFFFFFLLNKRTWRQDGKSKRAAARRFPTLFRNGKSLYMMEGFFLLQTFAIPSINLPIWKKLVVQAWNGWKFITEKIRSSILHDRWWMKEEKKLEISHTCKSCVETFSFDAFSKNPPLSMDSWLIDNSSMSTFKSHHRRSFVVLNECTEKEVHNFLAIVPPSFSTWTCVRMYSISRWVVDIWFVHASISKQDGHFPYDKRHSLSYQQLDRY